MEFWKPHFGKIKKEQKQEEAEREEKSKKDNVISLDKERCERRGTAVHRQLEDKTEKAGVYRVG